MNYIERMELELKELTEKIIKGAEFRDSEVKNPTVTDEHDRTILMVQLTYMSLYSKALLERIERAKNKNK